ncbi:M16 family metallopeptidase, partial [Pseudomonas aeruginosa]
MAARKVQITMKTPARRRVGLLLASLCLPLFAQAAETQPTHEFSLDNGLKVIVREDHRAPVVVSQLWYRIGSSYETPGLTGLSHALEHMMFKGSRKLGPGEASRVLRDLGAEENAFTTDDYTAYYQVLARDRLPVALEMEADRMAHLSLPADQFKSEIEVIKEERRLRTDDNPNALAFERFKAAAYPASGYHTPTIGWMADLQRMTIDDLRHWYESWYAPNNATLVVVGDVTADEVKTLAKRYFGEIPWRQLPPARKPLELAEPGERRLKLYVRTQLPNLIMGFNVPSLGSSENPREVNALRLIGALLDGGYSARLASRLERGEELVAGASTYYDAFNRGDSLF